MIVPKIENPPFNDLKTLKEQSKKHDWTNGIMPKHYMVDAKSGQRLPCSTQFLQKKNIIINCTNVLNPVNYGGLEPIDIPKVIKPGCESLVTPEMFAVLVGLIASDGYISPAGAITITQTLRQESNYSFALHIINILAPIISYVEICSSNFIEYDPNNYLEIDSEGKAGPNLDVVKIQNQMQDIINQIQQHKNKPIVKAQRQKIHKKHNSNSTGAFFIRIITYSIFQKWHKDWYNQKTDENQNNKNIKKWPPNFETIYTSPITLATHIMGDGGCSSSIVKNKQGIDRTSVIATVINLGLLNYELFDNILNRHFGLITFEREDKRTNIQAVFQGDLIKHKKKGRNQQLFYKLINPFLIESMEHKIINPFLTTNKVNLAPLTEAQKCFLPKQNIFNVNSKYTYTYYGSLFFDFSKFEVFKGAHRLELENGDLYMDSELEKLYLQYYSLERMYKKYFTQIATKILNSS